MYKILSEALSKLRKLLWLRIQHKEAAISNAASNYV